MGSKASPFVRTALRAALFNSAVVGAAVLVASPAAAEADLAGYYRPVMHEDQPERGPGPDAGEYMGLPINDAMRSRANTWNGSLLTIPERQCIPHPSTYGFRGVGNLHISDVRDNGTQERVKFETHIVWEAQHREIWMDGRQAPPESALHTWQGFSVGHWEGDVLVVKTSNLKPGWIRRNGLALSDKATMTERFIKHGDYINHVMMVEDPVYLTEPMVKTNLFQAMPNPNMGAYPCRPAIEVPRPPGSVPHNAFRNEDASLEFAQRHHLPIEAVRGGAETALPEFIDRFKPADFAAR
jgi:hypothetical protein